MLDERIVALARKTAGPQLKDLDKGLGLRAAGNRAQLHGHGQLYLVLLQLYENEIGKRAQVVWRSIHRAHQSFGATVSETLLQDLTEAFRANMNPVVEDLRPKFEQDMRGAPAGMYAAAKFTDALNHELARHETEIEHYVASLHAAAARGAASASQYAFYGNVGAVMTGQGAVANVVQNIGADQREAMLKALEIVKQAIAQAPELTARDRGELSEIADEVAAEVDKESPNTRRLSLTLQTLASAVQGISSGPGAYEVLRTAAAAIGISI